MARAERKLDVYSVKFADTPEFEKTENNFFKLMGEAHKKFARKAMKEEKEAEKQACQQ